MVASVNITIDLEDNELKKQMYKICEGYLWLRNSTMNLRHGVSFSVQLNTGGVTEVNKTPPFIYSIYMKTQPIFIFAIRTRNPLICCAVIGDPFAY